MSGNKTTPNASSVSTLVDAIADSGRRADANLLIALMKDATGESPKMQGPAIIGFGSYHYIYESGREGDAPLIGFSPRKAATVLYLNLGLGDSDTELEKLGKHTTGKGCLYIKKLADVDQKVLEKIIAKSVAGMRKKILTPLVRRSECSAIASERERVLADFEHDVGMGLAVENA